MLVPSLQDLLNNDWIVVRALYVSPKMSDDIKTCEELIETVSIMHR